MFKLKPKHQSTVVRSKELRKRDFTNWPFKIDTVKIYSLIGKSVYCNFNNEKQHYALNGFAHDLLGLPMISESNQVLFRHVNGQKIYADVGDMIYIGLNLFKESEISNLEKVQRQMHQLKSQY